MQIGINIWVDFLEKVNEDAIDIKMELNENTIFNVWKYSDNEELRKKYS